MAATISQLFCSPSNCNLHLSTVVRPRGGHLFRPKLSIRTSLEGNGAETSTSETQINLSHTAEVSKSDIVGAAKSHTTKDCLPENTGIIEPVKEHSVIQKKKAAKIHDFCFGIPYGGLVLGGGLIGFIFSGNPTTLFFGGGLLALSTLSLKIWRQGKSSLPFILGQTVLAGVILWKNLRTYTLTKKIFPTGFYAAISAAMLCFYSYVVASGGNPPPKKLNLQATSCDNCGI